MRTTIKLRFKGSLKAKGGKGTRGMLDTLRLLQNPATSATRSPPHTSLPQTWKTSQVSIAPVPLQVLVATPPEIPQLPYHSLLCVHNLPTAYLAILQLLTCVAGSLNEAGYSLGQQEFLYPIYYLRFHGIKCASTE